jgi:membrane protease YdiL (CAAX protease family)
VVFGFMHAVSPAYFVVATVMGLYLGALYHFTGNLVLASLVHAIYDWIAIEMVLRRIDRDPDAG